jgi:hypothetical protein
VTRGCAALLLVALLLGPRVARAEDPPPGQQALLLLRILAYDRKLRERTGGERVVIAVTAKPGDRSSDEAAQRMVRALGELARTTTVLGMKVDVVIVPFDPGLEEALKKGRFAALYVSPGLDDSVGLITPLTKRTSVMSMSPRPGPARDGLAVGLEVRDKRTAVIVNLQAARSEGVDFETAFLRVAEVIKP